MAVSISVDEPEIDITVRNYEGYTEATGIRAPLVMGSAASQKGDSSVAGGLSAAVVLGATSQKGGASVAGGISAQAVQGDAQSQKGDQSVADGLSSQVVAGDAQSGKGDASVADGQSLPVVMGAVQTQHLKPDHRWDLQQQPPNLYSDPENFDPANTVWVLFDSTVSLVDNVGPNGESAYKLEDDGNSNENTIREQGPPLSPPVSFGFYVRTVSGSTNNVRLRAHNVNDNNNFSSYYTVTTDWRWVEYTYTGSVDGKEFELRIEGSPGTSIYILRAQLNRGTSRAPFTTDSTEPQVIPDVIQGADLQNGSTDSADTNDLKQSTEGLVSDNDDFTGDVPAAVPGDGTWGLRFYLPAQGNLGGTQKLFGDRADGIELAWDESTGEVLAVVQDSGSNTKEARVSPSSPYSAAHTAMLTVSDSELRLDVNGTTATTDLSGFTPLANQHPVWNMEASGMEGRQSEKHGVLTEAEAEAVRQRLASDPEDPVPPTERWDFSAEASPHNRWVQSENIDPSSTVWSQFEATVTVDAITAPDGSTTAEKIESNGARTSRVQQAPPIVDGANWSFIFYAKPDTNNWCGLRRTHIDANGNAKVYLTSFDISNGAIGSTSLIFNGGGTHFEKGFTASMKELGSEWYRVSIITKAQDNVSIENAGIEILNGDESRPSGSGESIFVWGAQLVRGEGKMPPYAKTDSSIAYPQTVPALRDPSNDLTLGSTASADTNDAGWRAPTGLVHDGTDDEQRTATRRPIATWSAGIEYSSTRAFGRSANGWKVTNTDLIAEDTSGNTVSASHGVTLNDDNRHALTVLVDTVTGEAKLYVDMTLDAAATLDLSQIGTLKSSDVELLPDGGLLSHAEVYTRALSGNEALHARQRILDNPNSTLKLTS